MSFCCRCGSSLFCVPFFLPYYLCICCTCGTCIFKTRFFLSIFLSICCTCLPSSYSILKATNFLQPIYLPTFFTFLLTNLITYLLYPFTYLPVALHSFLRTYYTCLSSYLVGIYLSTNCTNLFSSRTTNLSMDLFIYLMCTVPASLLYQPTTPAHLVTF